MSPEGRPEFGAISWIYFTVPDASDTKNDCAAVVGWQATPHNMGAQMFCVIQDPAGATAGLIAA